MTAEIVSAALPTKFPKLKNLFSTRPETLVKMGAPDLNALKAGELQESAKYSERFAKYKARYAFPEDNE